jgi:hypothetical protein
MDEDEEEICTYLKTWSGQFVSGREIARKAGGKWRFRDNPIWATPILLRLVEKGILESDSTGYYRLKPKLRKKPKKWVSPQLKAILEKSGKNFGDLLDADDNDD